MSWVVSTSGYKATTNAANCTTAVASPGVVGGIPHCAVAGDKVVFATTGALPTGLVAGTTYYVISAGLTGNAFEVAATPGGSAINFTGSTSGQSSVTIEHIIATDTNNATFWMDFSLVPMTSGPSGTTTGDAVELRAYDQMLSSGSAPPGNSLAQCWKGSYAGPQATDHKQFPFIPSDQQVQYTVKCLSNPYSGTVTFTASSANITFASNILQQNDVVQFTNSGGALPTGISALTNYFVITASNTSPFQVSATLGGSAVVPSTAGTGTQTVTRVGHSYAYKLLRQ